MAASREDGTTLRAADAEGTCLARYQVEHNVLAFSLDDACLLEQVDAILPEVAAYEAGLLDFLLRGELQLATGAELAVTGQGLGAGTAELYIEDDRGVRTKLGSAAVRGGGAPGAPAELLRVAAPGAGVRAVAIFRGVDLHGEPLIAVGAMPLPR